MKKILVVLVVLGFVAPATAAEWNWWGSMRVLWSYSNLSKELSASGEDDFDGNNGVISIPELGATHMIGAEVQASDTISASFQIGQTSSEDAIFLENFGMWNFGPGTLKVGHFEMPLTTIYSLPNGVDDNPFLGPYLYVFRRDSIQLQFGGLEIALAKNTGTGLDGFIGADDVSDEEHIIPRTEVAYTYRTDMLNVKAGIGFQTFAVKNITQDRSESVNSIMALLGTRVRFGPAFVTVGGWYGVNPGQYPAISPNVGDESDFSPSFVDGEVRNATVLSTYLAGGYAITDTVSVGAGVGYAVLEKNRSATVKLEDNAISWYFQVPLTVAPGVSITPEVGGFILGDRKLTGQADTARGTQTYFSTKFQIEF